MTGLGNIDDVYKHYLKVIEENKHLEKKLEIAVNALEEIYRIDEGNSFFLAEESLAKIKEIK